MIGAAPSTAELAADEATRHDFGAVLNAAPLAVIVTDEKGEITHVNLFAESSFGYTSAKAIGVDIRSFMVEQPGPGNATSVDAFLATVPLPHSAMPRHSYARRNDRTTFPVEVSIAVLDDERRAHGRIIAFYFRDLTERVARDERLARMRDAILADLADSAVDEFAAGLAHEVNQPLAAASYFISAGEALLADAANHAQGAALVRLGGEQLLRCGEVVRQCRARASIDVPVLSRTRVSTVVGDAIAMAYVAEAEPTVSIVQTCEPGAETIYADPTQLTQAICVLLLHAGMRSAAATPTRRVITFSAKVVTAETIELTIADTDSQLREPLLPLGQIPGGNSDLAIGGATLSHVRRVVAAHGGTFAASRLPTGGTLFTLILPRAQGQTQGPNS